MLWETFGQALWHGQETVPQRLSPFGVTQGNPPDPTASGEICLTPAPPGPTMALMMNARPRRREDGSSQDTRPAFPPFLPAGGFRAAMRRTREGAVPHTAASDVEGASAIRRCPRRLVMEKRPLFAPDPRDPPSHPARRSSGCPPSFRRGQRSRSQSKLGSISSLLVLCLLCPLSFACKRRAGGAGPGGRDAADQRPASLQREELPLRRPALQGVPRQVRQPQGGARRPATAWPCRLLDGPERDYQRALEALQPLAGAKDFADHPFVLYYLGAGPARPGRARAGPGGSEAAGGAAAPQRRQRPLRRGGQAVRRRRHRLHRPRQGRRARRRQGIAGRSGVGRPRPLRPGRDATAHRERRRRPRRPPAPS